MATQQHYLVTGGAGFIGSHLTDSLLRDGHRVTILDNLSTGRMSNLRDALHQDNCRFVHGSVVDPYVVDDLVSQCDVVVHLAAAVGVELIMSSPLRAFFTNVRGGEIVLEAAHRYNKRVFMASTSEIYGKNGGDAMPETSDRVLGPPDVTRWSYSTSKAVDEILTNLYHEERGVSTVIARFFNTVGPRQSHAYGMVVPRLVRQALKNEDLTVYGDGLQTRCFTHVNDVIRAVRIMLDSDEVDGMTFNIGNPHEISIHDLAERIIEVTGSASSIRVVTYEDAFHRAGYEDMRRRVPDITRIRTVLGWEPELGLEKILDDVITSMNEDISFEGVEFGHAPLPTQATVDEVSAMAMVTKATA